MSVKEKRGRRRQGGEPSGPSRPKAAGGAAAWLAILTAAAFVFRAAHVLASRANPFFQNLLADSSAYDQWGQRIAAGQWIGRGVFYQDPLYPYFLGVFYALFGRHLTALLLVQSALGAANVLFLREIASRLWNRRAGNVAAVLAALYAPFWFYDGLVLKTFLEVLLLNAALLALISAAEAGTRREGMRRGVLSGILLGLGSLARANYLILAPLMLGWLLHPASRPSSSPGAHDRTPRQPGDSGARKAGVGGWWRGLPARSVAAGTCLAAGMLLVLLPVLVRNRVAGHDWVLTTAQGG
jgi:hypothetical protein